MPTDIIGASHDPGSRHPARPVCHRVPARPKRDGVVYLATDPSLKRTVAIKLLPPDLTRDGTAKQRFLQEAQAASALDHPNICTIHEINETADGQLYLVMAHYEGETLKERIAQGPLELDDANRGPAPSPVANRGPFLVRSRPTRVPETRAS